MTIVTDPEGLSSRHIQEFYDFTGYRVLEIGCGEGRITMAIAENSQHVTAIDPDEDDILTAVQNTPTHLKDKINFITSSIADFDQPSSNPKFDIALFTWSL